MFVGKFFAAEVVVAKKGSSCDVLLYCTVQGILSPADTRQQASAKVSNGGSVVDAL